MKMGDYNVFESKGKLALIKPQRIGECCFFAAVTQQWFALLEAGLLHYRYYRA